LANQLFPTTSRGDLKPGGRIVSWLVGVGDYVAPHQVVCVLDVDDELIDMTSPYSGTVLAVGGRSGDLIPVGADFMMVGDANELPDPEDEITAPVIPINKLATIEASSPVLPPVQHPIDRPPADDPPDTQPTIRIASFFARRPEPEDQADANPGIGTDDAATPDAEISVTQTDDVDEPEFHDPEINEIEVEAEINHVAGQDILATAPEQAEITNEIQVDTAQTESAITDDDFIDPGSFDITNINGADFTEQIWDETALAEPIDYAMELSDDPPLGPIVRRLVDEYDIDVSTIVGTGPGGRITRADIADVLPTTFASQARGDLPTLVQIPNNINDDTTDDSDDVDDVYSSLADEIDSSVEAAPASAVLRDEDGTTYIPQFSAMIEIDAGPLLATQSALAQRTEAEIPLDAILCALLMPVLRDNPVNNACRNNGEIVYHERFDIGIAFDSPGGMLAPVIRDADEKSVSEIAAEIVGLVKQIEEGSVEASDLSNPTCTINNVGAHGLLSEVPLLPPLTSTAVSFGMTRAVVRLDKHNPVEVPTMVVTASFDHRLIDSALAARFLNHLKQYLEVPALASLG